MAVTAVTGFTEPFQDTHPFYRGTYFRVVTRTATGPGNGTSSVAHGAVQLRLSKLTDFNFPYLNGGRFYLGVRAVITVTATAEGTGTASSVAQVLRQRQASGNGAGDSTATSIKAAIRTATGSGIGTADSTENVINFYLRTATGSGEGTSTASRIRVPVRTASATGSGTQTADWNINPVRNATGNGVGSATTISIHVVVRTSTGTGQGTAASSAYVTVIRTSSGSGEGTSTTIGARALFRTCTGSGLGTGTADWDKSHIFRVPTTTGYPFAERLSTEPSDRLFSYTPQGVRAYNLYKLTDGTYQITDPRRPERIVKVYLGGHDNFLDATEIAELTAAGFGSSIT
jgi:hypothetical protein